MSLLRWHAKRSRSRRHCARSIGIRSPSPTSPSYADATWVSPYLEDPFATPTAEKVGLLVDYSGRLQAADGVDHVTASVLQVKEQTFYADLAGSSITQQRVRLHPEFEATAVDKSAGSFESMRTLAPPVGRGWEYLGAGEHMELGAMSSRRSRSGWPRRPRHRPSKQVRTDLVIDPTNLWLTIHESIGHATEYDRAIGYEAAYAGTSFATPDKLGTLKYGTPLMHVTADRNEEARPGQRRIRRRRRRLSTVGSGGRGNTGRVSTRPRVRAEGWGLTRSNGCSYADSAHHVPIQRMANVSLSPDPSTDTSTADLISRVENGIYVVGDKSWSIDMQR